MVMSRYDICPLCNNQVVEGDECVVITMGQMLYSIEGDFLYAEPIEDNDGLSAKYIYHTDCFEDGPEREEPELTSVPLEEWFLDPPHCVKSQNKLVEGDIVYYLQMGVKGKSEESVVFEVFYSFLSKDKTQLQCRVIYILEDEVLPSLRVWVPPALGKIITSKEVVGNTVREIFVFSGESHTKRDAEEESYAEFLGIE